MTDPAHDADHWQCEWCGEYNQGKPFGMDSNGHPVCSQPCEMNLE